MKQLNTVICNLNSQYIHSSLAPYYLMAGVKNFCTENIKVYVVEGTVNENIRDVANRIIAFKPKVLGLCCYIWNITAVKELICIIKQQIDDLIFVLGGPEVSYNANSILKENRFVDFIISGEGELPFSKLLNAILNDENTYDIPGLCFRRDGEIIVSEPYVSKEEPPSPFTPEYFKSLNGRIAYLESSRGCPYSCAFCLSGRCGCVRFFDLERTKKEMELLSKSGTKTIKFADRTFNANRRRAYEIFEYIIENRQIFKDVCFHFEIAGDILDDKTIELLSKAPAGSIQFEIGLQSFNKKTLEAINRKTNIERLKKNIKKIISGQNIHTHIDLIAGLPYENWSSIVESFNTAFSLKPNMLQFGFLKLLFGSPMHEMRDKFPCVYNTEPPYEVLKTPWLSKDELFALHSLEGALDKIYNSGRFKRTIDYLLNFYSPFELFYEFGKENVNPKISLDEYTKLIYDFFSRQKGIDAGVLRDKMVCDRLATNSSGILPSVLQIRDKNLKKYKNIIPKRIGVKTGFAYLYTENSLVYAYYDNKNPVTGEYSLYKIKA